MKKKTCQCFGVVVAPKVGKLPSKMATSNHSIGLLTLFTVTFFGFPNTWQRSSQSHNTRQSNKCSEAPPSERVDCATLADPPFAHFSLAGRFCAFTLAAALPNIWEMKTQL
jgi:hypothetical protein